MIAQVAQLLRNYNIKKIDLSIPANSTNSVVAVLRDILLIV